MSTSGSFPPIAPIDDATDTAPTTWPTWYGVIAIILGGFLLLGSCCGAIWMQAMPMIMGRMGAGDFPPIPPVMKWVTIADLPVSIVLGVLLVRGGIQLLRRRPKGRSLLVTYAGVRLALAVPLLAAGYLMMQPSVEWGAAIARMQIDALRKANAQAKVPPQLEAAANADQPTFVNWASLLGGSALGLAFPVAVMLQMSRPRIKDEVASWAPESANQP